ncbi:serine hydrolase domain-containing protein [Luteimonas pelagia]
METRQSRTRHARWRGRALAGAAALGLLAFAVASANQFPGTVDPQPAPEAAATPDTLAMVEVSTAAATPAVATPTAQTARPLANGFDVREFESMAQALVANQRVPGLAMAIVHDGRVLSARGYGITDVRAAEPVDAHTVFRLASLSKGFAGTLTGMLVSEGALRWDSRVAEYMPQFRLNDPIAARQLTVADVLSHRVGLPHHTYDRDIESNADYRDLVNRLYQTPLRCAPGACYGYQNVAFSLIGDVVFAATGQFYSQAIERRLFGPLGMVDASLGLEGIEASSRWARPHVRGRGGWVSLRPKPTYYRLPPAAGVNASAHDMAQWLLAQGGHRPDVLPAPLLATLHTPLVDTPTEIRGGAGSWRRQRLQAAGYGLGWRIYDYAGHDLVYHAGAVQGYRGMIALLPDRDLGIAVLWNGESSLPSALLPTVLDRAIGLAPQSWLQNGVLADAAAFEASGATPGRGISQYRDARTQARPGARAGVATAAPR